MKKRILSALTALALCLTLLPAAAQAAGDTHPSKHCVCGKSDCTEAGHEKITFTKWLASSMKQNSNSWDLSYDEAEKTSGQTVDKDGSGNWVLNGGNYYLKTGDGFDTDVTIDKPIVIQGNVTICLNGKTIQSEGEGMPVFQIENRATLTLTDCQNNNNGKVTHASGVAG